MKIAVFGGTGFVGNVLIPTLKTKGWEPIVLDIRRDSSWASKMKECDAVINLAGHPLFKERWSTPVKAALYDSRVEGTHAIVQAMANSKVKVLVNASAIGIYGPGERICTEASSHADDFLARVCKAWEDEAMGAKRMHKIRTVCTRFGIILGKGGGALKALLPPFKLGMGGPIGCGHQSMSWVHIDDVVGLLIHAITNDKLEGPLNVTSPNIVSNKSFSKILGKVLHRPAVIPVPKIALHILLGEAAGVIASGQHVHPEKALQSGYVFKHPQIEEALAAILIGESHRS